MRPGFTMALVLAAQATAHAEVPPAAPEEALAKILEAHKNGSLAGCGVGANDDPCAILKPDSFGPMSARWAPRLQGGYRTKLIGRTPHGRTVQYRWRVELLDKRGNLLVSLAITDHKVSGILFHDEGPPPPPSAGPVTLPDTPAARAFSTWLTAINSGERQQLEAMLEQFREPRPVERALSLRKLSGGFELRQILDSSPTRIQVLVEEREGDNLAQGHMEVEPTPPHRVTRWDLGPVPRPAHLAISRMSEADAIQALKARIDRLAAQDLFSGSVLVARHGKVLFTDVRGRQDREQGLPNRLDTKYNLGSMNKMFTAVAVMQLVQVGKLKLTDTVGKHLPDYPNPEVAGQVTIEHLLTHTGGMGNIFGPEFDANLEKLKAPADYIALYGKRAPEFPPGSRFAYSNYGMVLAGAIVERASGMSYYDYVRKNVYRRAGMGNTDSYWKTEPTPNLAKGYRTGPDGLVRDNYQSRPLRGSPAGGGYSTVEDLLRFARALTGYKLLDAKLTALMTTCRSGAPGGGYGHGFACWNQGDAPSFGHNGGAPGINADLKIFRETGYVVVVMSNLDPPAASRVSDFIAARLPAK
jgi:D-alanyl-D-alanine carboxypeptidase